MVYILFFAVFTFFFIQGFHAVTREGMLLSFLGIRLNEQREIDRLERELEADKLLYLDQFTDDVVQLGIYDSEDSDYAKITKSFTGVILSRSEIDKDMELLRQQLDQKLDTKKWKLLLAIAPAWSECPVCMSSLWSSVIGGLLAVSVFFNFGVYLVLPLTPIAIAGMTATVLNLSNKAGLANIEDQLKNIADGQ